MLRIAVVVFAALVAVNAASTRIMPIFHGEDSGIRSYPYQISLETYGRHVCGGAIISERWVLTAAHCLVARPMHMTIRAGTSYGEQGGTVHRVNATYNLKGYTVRPDNKAVFDLAMVQLRDPIVFSDVAQPIRMVDQNVYIKPGTWGIVTGWGRTPKYDYKGQLQSVAVPVYSHKQCQEMFGDDPLTGLPQDNICAGDGLGRGTCNGDSGSPLTVNGKLVGLVSWGPKDCGSVKSYSGYVDIPYHRDTIREVTGV